MPVRVDSCFNYHSNIEIRYDLMKEIAHRANENSAMFFPVRGLPQFACIHPGLKTPFEWMTFFTLETIQKTPCVAMLTPFANLRAANHRIPGRIRPFYLCFMPHISPFLRALRASA